MELLFKIGDWCLHFATKGIQTIAPKSLIGYFLILLIVAFVIFLLTAIKVFRNASQIADICIAEGNEYAELQVRLNDLLQRRGNILEILLKVHEEIILKGSNANLKKQEEKFTSQDTEIQKEIEILQQKVDTAKNKLDKLDHAFDKASNKAGKVWAINTVLVIGALFYITAQILAIANLINPDYRDMLINFGHGIDSKFYEITAQIILALSVALFIGKNSEENAKKPRWWAYSQFAGAVTCAIAGLFCCLYIVGGGKSNLYIFTITASCSINLLYNSLKPLLGKKITK
jgi:hypothetical protein